MSEEQDGHQEVDAQTLWDKVKTFFVPQIREEVQQELAKQAETEPDPDPEPIDKPGNDGADQTAALEKAFNDRLQTIEKAHKDKIEALAVELEKAKDERERREWLEKAQSMPAVPVKAEELAEKLHALAKSDGDLAGWFEATLKAVDAQLRDAGLYKEVGTSQEGEELSLVEKATKLAKEQDIPLKEALLQVNPEEGYDYLRQRRKTMREA